MLTGVLVRGGFELAQWGSSHPDTLKAHVKKGGSSVYLDLDRLPVERTLGLWWDCAKGTFMNRLNVQAGGKTKQQLL